MDFGFQVDKGVWLRLPMPHHADEIAAVVLANLKYLQEWMPWATDNYSVASARFYIKNNLEALAAGTGFANSIVYEGKICGQIGFHDLDAKNKSTHTGYWLSADLQGKGIVTNCCRAMFDYAFAELKLNRIQINCNIENAKSRAIPERLGFRLEGVHRQAEFLNHRFGDSAIYGMLAEDWTANSGTNPQRS